MSNDVIRIATRKSPLALWQAEYIKAGLQQAHPGLQVELLGMSTKGDKFLDAPLAKVGGKGLFVKELETAMLDGRADLAVHSMKDVPMEFPDGLGLSIICEREDPRDAFVSNQYACFDDLPQGARVGTSSLRRQCQVREQRPDIKLLDLRGNVNTRLAKMDAGEFDAIILAQAGLLRLGMDDRIAESLPVELSLPAGGQGAVGVEIRLADDKLKELLAPLHHPATAALVTAERALNRRLQGGCQVPIACYAVEDQDLLWLRGLVGSIQDQPHRIIRAEGRCPLNNIEAAEALGIAVADDLLRQGAGELLQAAYGDD